MLKPILLVEDNPKDLELTLVALERSQLANEVIVVEDGAEALDYLHRRGKYEDMPSGKPAVALLEKEPYAMLVTDVTLPKMSGIELVALVRSRCPQMPVVVASGYGRTSALDGADVRYLKKPYQLSDLQQVIAQGLQQKAAGTAIRPGAEPWYARAAAR